MKYDLIIIFGGDGTINEVVNGISEYLSLKVFKILIIPIGSGNDFVKNFYSNIVLKKIELVFDKISLNKYQSIKTDLGKIVFNELHDTIYEKYFINAVGFGFDAFVAYYKNKLKFFSGLMAYLISIFFVLLNYTSFKVIFKSGSKSVEKESLLITVANGVSSGGGFYLTPDAEITDSFLDIGLVRYLNIINIFIKIPLVLFNKTKKLINDIQFYKINNVTLIFSKNVFCHIDGEMADLQPKSATISVLPSALEVIIIEEWNVSKKTIK